MNHDLNKDLEAQKEDWSPNSASLNTMLQTAHHRANKIKKTRRNTALALSFLESLDWLGSAKCRTVNSALIKNHPEL